MEKKEIIIEIKKLVETKFDGVARIEEFSDIDELLERLIITQFEEEGEDGDEVIHAVTSFSLDKAGTSYFVDGLHREHFDIEYEDISLEVLEFVLVAMEEHE